MRKITVLLADDHTIFRQAVRSLLETTDDIDVVGEAANGHRAVTETRRLHPDVVLMDIGMPRLNGVEATRRISRQLPAAKVLILSTYGDDQHVRQAIAAGAAGYLTKAGASVGLLRAIRQAGGKATSNRWIGSRPLKSPQKHELQSTSSGVPALSSRQTEVLQLIAEGCSSKQIAGLLSLSVKTVEKHRQGVMDKLGIHEVASLTRYAVSNGVAECNCAPIDGYAALAPAQAPNFRAVGDLVAGNSS